MKREAYGAGLAAISYLTLSLISAAYGASGSLSSYIACTNALNSEELEGIYNFSVALSPAAKPKVPFASTKNYAAIAGEHKGKAGFFVYTPGRAFFFDPGLKNGESLSTLVWEDSACFKISTPDQTGNPLYLEFHASWDDPQQGYFNFIANEAAPVGFQASDLKAGSKLQHAHAAEKKCRPLAPKSEILDARTRGYLEKEIQARFLTMMTSEFPKSASPKLLKEMESAMSACKSIEEREFRNSILAAESAIRAKMPRSDSAGSRKGAAKANKAK